MNNTMFTKEEQKLLALWAADCAQHVLKYFEKKYPADKRPRKAIKAAREWAVGNIKCGEARKAALAAHAAARKAPHYSAAQFAARAAGQAVATAHVPEHAFGAAYYALKIAMADSDKTIAKEIEWQSLNTPKNIMKKWKDWQSKRLPKRLR